MAQIGNKQNAAINGEWARHVRWMKKMTSKIRRAMTRTEIKRIKENIKNLD